MSRYAGVLSMVLGLAGSAFGAEAPTMPMAVDEARAAHTRWLKKEVLESRLIDGMENPARWSHSGPGQMSFTAERAREGKQSIRLVSRTISDRPNPVVGRPWGEANLRCNIAGEDWTKFNRISIWVYPEMPGFKIGSVVLKILNDDKVPGMWTHGPMHYALVKPGQWNHIVWEIPHLQREKVTAVELTYRLQGSEPGTATSVSFDWDQLELQRVEADYFEGWAVAPNQIAFSHSGYEVSGLKTAIANTASWAGAGELSEFGLIEKDSGKLVLRRPVRTVKGSLGEFQVLDFSECTTAGEYLLQIGKVRTPSFRIGQNIWRETIWKTINFFYCERCGEKIEGIHEVCHEDWQTRHEGKTLVINGGWHDAGDLSQGLINTGEATYAMYALAESLKESDAALSQRLMEEAKWGLAWLHKTRFGDGFRVTWGTLDYWTDNKIGTIDDTFAEARDTSTDNAVGAAASAIAARLQKDIDPALASKSLEIAKADWQFSMEKLRNPNAEALGAATLASVELYKTTGERKYAEKAVELGKMLVECQQRTYPNWEISLAGFFYNSPRRDRILNFAHRGHDQAPVVALAELCKALPGHADWMQWYSAVAMHSEYQRAAAAFNEPYQMLNAGIYRLSDNAAAVSQGMKLSEDYYLRRFPAWGDTRGHFGILLSQTKALAAAGGLRNRPELFELCQSQLQWVVGKNPFAQSTMYGEGYDYAPQYTAVCGDMVGSLPVGIQTMHDRDVPYLPFTNCWNYKEVWVHPSSRWLFTMADLCGPRAKQTVAFELSEQAGADGKLTITAKVTGTGRHTFAIRAFNLEMDLAEQTVELQAGQSQTLTWSGSIRSNDTPWVAVVYPDHDLAQRKDLAAGAKRTR